MQYETEAEIVVNPDGTFAPVIPPVAEDGDVEGLICKEGEERYGGFEGYAEGEYSRIIGLVAAGQTKGIIAKVIINTSPAKAKKWHETGWATKDKDNKPILKKYKAPQNVIDSEGG